MSDMSKSMFIGHLGRDPEMSVTQTGLKLCRFSFAVNEKYKEKETVLWLNVVAFDKLGEIAAQYLRKGSKIYIEGRIQPPKIYDRQDGTKGVSLDLIAREINFLDAKRDAVDQQPHEYDEPKQAAAQPSLPTGGDDDLPF